MLFDILLYIEVALVLIATGLAAVLLRERWIEERDRRTLSGIPPSSRTREIIEKAGRD